MKHTHRRLSSVSLDTAISDPLDRGTMPMSTLIASDLWLLETSWDGESVGDIQVFKNAACGQSGVRVGPEDKWVWWAGVPRGKIKSYRFVELEPILPMTTHDEGLPFELPRAERKEKPDQAGKSGPAAA